MLKGLTREVRWREVTDGTPQETGYVLVAYLTPSIMPDEPDYPACREGYWNGREFLDMKTLRSLPAVTHWMPYPALPSVDAMRRVFRELLGKEKEEMPC